MRTLIVLALAASGLASPALAQVKPFVPATSDGKEPNDTVEVGPLSADGRYVVFVSRATNLVSDTLTCYAPTCSRIFVLDRDSDADGIFDEAGATATTLVSRTPVGVPFSFNCEAPSISDDGRYVAFTCHGDRASSQVYVHDRQIGTTRMVSVSTAGDAANPGTDRSSGIISGNGRIVVFRSWADNLVPGDTNSTCQAINACWDLFVHELGTGRTTRVNVSTPGTQSDAATYYPGLSADGRFVAFSADATTLVAGDTNSVQDVFVHDLLTATTERVSVTTDGVQGTSISFGQPRPALGADGRLVFFASQAPNLPRGPVYDRETHTTSSACEYPDGVQVWCADPSLSRDGRWLLFTSRPSIVVRDLHRRRSTAVVTGYQGTSGTICTYSTTCYPRGPSFSPNGRFITYNDNGAFLVDLDADGDGLPNDFEQTYGLDPMNGTGADGPQGDPDGDGLTNAEEFDRGSHPRGFFSQHFAEGAVSDSLTAYTVSRFLDTQFAVLNPDIAAASVLMRFMRADGTVVPLPVTVPARSRRTVDARSVPGLAQRRVYGVGLSGEGAEFSTVVESDRQVVVDRTMTWDYRRYGAHAETAVAAPALTWYLAEGATHSGFNLFYLLQNPNAKESEVRVRYLRPSGPPLEKTYTLAPTSRTNIWVDLEEFPGVGPALADTDVSAAFEVLNGQPIIVERAMYFDVPGQTLGAGHESAGITAPATEWFLAEGATGPFFDLFVLIANPGLADAQVEASYLLPNGTTLTKSYWVAASSRFNIWVDYEDAMLANTAVSTTIRSLNGVPIIVERAMWWPDGGWYETHNSPATTTTGTLWAMADGEVDAARNLETYILVANTSAAPADTKVTLLFEDGTSVEQTYPGIPARSRFNVPVGGFFQEAAGKRFGAIVESLGATPAEIVVERAVYWDVDGQRWAAGTNALATRLVPAVTVGFDDLVGDGCGPGQHRPVPPPHFGTWMCSSVLTWKRRNFE